MRFNELSKQRRFLFRYRVRILSIAIFSFAVVIGSMLLYPITSSLFVTPIETVVGKSNEQLKDQYNKMVEQVTLLDEVLNDIKSRDKSIYQQLFGVDVNEVRPDYEMVVNREQTEKRRLALDSLPFAELVSILIDGVDQLDDQTKKVSKKLDDCGNMVEKRSDAFRNIPSMQPINNNDLSKNITPAGMCINPFVKSFFMHKGIDYSIPEETRVYATANGTVETVMASGEQGGTIVISHGNGYTTSYGNLSKTTVASGESVKRGAIIGYSGNTGTSFLPHLHYEIKYRSKNLDPFDFFFGELSKKEMERIKIESAQNIQSFD